MSITPDAQRAMAFRESSAASISLVAELSVLYEICSLSSSASEQELAEDAAEKAARLFGARRFALLKETRDKETLTGSWAVRDVDHFHALASEGSPSQFYFSFSVGPDENGAVFLEQTRPIDERARRLYTIFAKRIQGLLCVFRDAAERRRMEEVLEKRIVALTRPLDQDGGVEFEDLFNIEDIQRLQDEFAKAVGVSSLITRPDGTPITKPSNFSRFCSEIIRQTEQGRINCATSDATLGRYHPDGPIIHTCLGAGLWGAGASIAVGNRHIANWLIGQVRDEAQSEDGIRAYAVEIGGDPDEMAAAFREIPWMSRSQFEAAAHALFTLATQLSNTAYQNVQQARFITDRNRAETEKERLQAQLLQAQKMESVGRLAGGVAHDFNNMLCVILGHVEIALNRVGPEDPLREELLEIQKAAFHSVDLTRQLLAFARRQTIAPKILDLNNTVEGMLKMLRRLMGENITLEWAPQPGLWPVRLDPAQVDQILANLCVNARDAITGAGRVTIETGNILVDDDSPDKFAELAPGKYVVLSVSDTGRGMERDVLEHLFEPFFTTKDLGQGTGLGLATIYGIVKQNGGTIRVHSEQGRGTVFRIYLPSRENEAIAPEAPGREEELRRGTETILLVEDEAAILRLSTRILRELGYNVLAAGTAEEAIRLVNAHDNEVDLLVTDVIMPDMNGRELARHLQAHLPNLKVLFMSGYTADVIADHGVLEEGVRFIQKPFSMREIASRIREVLHPA